MGVELFVILPYIYICLDGLDAKDEAIQNCSWWLIKHYIGGVTVNSLADGDSSSPLSLGGSS